MQTKTLWLNTRSPEQAYIHNSSYSSDINSGATVAHDSKIVGTGNGYDNSNELVLGLITLSSLVRVPSQWDPKVVKVEVEVLLLLRLTLPTRILLMLQ